MKYKRKISLFTLLFLCCFTYANTYAATGYTYNHSGQTVYSTEGFVIEDKPLTYNNLGIPVESSSPQDLFVFNGENEITIYLTDSGLNQIVAFDENFNIIKSFKKVVFDPYDLTNTDVLALKSNGAILFSSQEDIDSAVSKDIGEDGLGDGLLEIQFKNPNSVYRAVLANDKDMIYIADKGNNQVLICEADSYDDTLGTYKVSQVITKPTAELDAAVVFSPKNVAVSGPGRVYVIADNITEGIMEFSEKDGSFNRYVGTNKVTLTAWEIFWRSLSTEEQLEKQQTLYNTTFTSIAFKGMMIYTTSYAIVNKSGNTDDTIMIKKINPSAKDVLRRNGYHVPKGDLTYAYSRSMVSSEFGPSTFVSITVNEIGNYSVLDSKRGRIFTYDNEGNLLYISGGSGTQLDKLNNPVALQYLKDDLIVLDANSKSIVRYKPTEIASVINQAIEQEYIGRITRENISPVYNDYTKTWWFGKENTGITGADLEAKVVDGYWWIGNTKTEYEDEPLAAADYWEKVISLNANYEYAYIGIGRMYMKNKEYRIAMEYFKKGYDTVNYGKAFKQYRDRIIKDNILYIIIGLGIIVILPVGFKIYHNSKYQKAEETGVGDE